MNSLYIVAPLVVAVIGLLLFFGGLGAMVHGRAGKATVNLGFGGVLAVIGLAAGLVGLNLQSYSRLTYEVPLATVSVKAINPSQKLYAVTVTRLDQTHMSQTCTLQGDAWELGGRFQTWKPWAVELGMNATYTLDQLSNRYYSAAEANGRFITACNINGPAPKVNQLLPDGWVRWLMSHVIVQNRFFGSASFMPMVDGARYTVIATQFGFNAEPANEIAAQANRGRAF